MEKKSVSSMILANMTKMRQIFPVRMDTVTI